MKYIFLILICFLGIAGYSQPIVNRSNSNQTVQDARLKAQLNLFIPIYTDTTQANAGTNEGIDSSGALIYTRNPYAIWYRKNRQWVQLLNGGATGDAWQLTGNTISSGQFLGTINNLALALKAYNKNVASFNGNTMIVSLGDIDSLNNGTSLIINDQQGNDGLTKGRYEFNRRNLKIGQIDYIFPPAQGAPGSYLYNPGNGVLNWNIPGSSGTFTGVDSVTISPPPPAPTTSVCYWIDGIQACYPIIGNGVDSAKVLNDTLFVYANGDSVAYPLIGDQIFQGDTVTIENNLLCVTNNGEINCILINNGGQFVDSGYVSEDSALYYFTNGENVLFSLPTLLKEPVAGNSGIYISDSTIDGIPKIVIYNTGSSGGNFINNERFTTQSSANYNISGAGLSDSLLSNQLKVSERAIVGDSLATINNPSFIFYGNSVTAGAFVQAWEAWAYITSSCYHATYLNRAISGTRMTASSPTDSSMINRLYTVQDYTAGQYIFIMYGINDNAAGVDSGTYKTTAARVIDTLLIARGYPASHIILCTPPYNASGGGGLNNIRLATINLANAKGVVGVDVYGYMTGSGYTDNQMILPDGIHPTVLGQRLISEKVINQLSTSLSAAGVLNVYGGGYVRDDLSIGQNARIDGGLTVHGDSTFDAYKLTMYKKNSGSNTTYAGIGIESDSSMSIFSPRSSVTGLGSRSYAAGNTFTPVLRVYNALNRVSINTVDLGFALSVGGNYKGTGYINIDDRLIVGGSGGASTIANGLSVSSGGTSLAAGLTVGGDANASDLRWKHYVNGFSVNGIGTTSSGNFNLGYGAGDLVFNQVSSSDGVTLTEYMRLKRTTGNLGIGLTAPTAKLHIVGTDSNVLKMSGLINTVLATDSALVIDTDGKVKKAAKSSGGSADSTNLLTKTATQSVTGATTFANTSVGSANLTVTGGVQGGSDHIGLQVGGTYASTTDAHPVNISPVFSPASTGLSIAGANVSLTTTGSQNMGHLLAFQGTSTHNGSGTMQQLYGADFRVVNNGGRDTTAYGTYIADATGTGTVRNNYGLWVESMTKGYNQNYGVYLAGTGRNFLNKGLSELQGNVIIGSTTDGATPAANLEIRKTTSGASFLMENNANDFMIRMYSSQTNATFRLLGGSTAKWYDDGKKTFYSSGRDSSSNSGLFINQSLATAYRASGSSSVTLAEDITFNSDATTGNVTVNIPTAVGITGRIYVVRKSDASGNTVTLDPSGSETINGSTTVVLSSQYSFRMIQSDGANWMIISQL